VLNRWNVSDRLQKATGLRTVEADLNYMEREAVAALELREFVASPQQEFPFDEEN
jgi:hypothetical protein